MALVQHLEGLATVAHGGDGVTGTLQESADQKTGDIIIVGQQYLARYRTGLRDRDVRRRARRFHRGCPC